MCAKEAALRAYDGPSLFAVPGNHDWIDGLECFQRHIQHKGWMGGWLMPQVRRQAGGSAGQQDAGQRVDATGIRERGSDRGLAGAGCLHGSCSV